MNETSETFTDKHWGRRCPPKAEWGDGPWQTEPDKVTWHDETTDMACMIVRGPLGALCGYVGVPPGHPWHGVSFMSIGADTHGGLSYSDACGGDVCHVPAAGKPHDVWWVGFDCGHGFDLKPAHRPMLNSVRGLTEEMVTSMLGMGEQYRDIDYVRRTVLDLAQQAAQAA